MPIPPEADTGPKVEEEGKREAPGLQGPEDRSQMSREMQKHQGKGGKCFIKQTIFHLKGHLGTSLAVQWLRRHASTAGGTGSIPGPGTKIPHAMWCSQKKKGHPLVIHSKSKQFLRKSFLFQK